jgi:hypothetical protein
MRAKSIIINISNPPCLTCLNLPKLIPCKVLTGNTIQYFGRCKSRKPSPTGINRNDKYTPLWIDFEKHKAWEEADNDIISCDKYKSCLSGN